jgi:hypothetical protein
LSTLALGALGSWELGAIRHPAGACLIMLLAGTKAPALRIKYNKVVLISNYTGRTTYNIMTKALGNSRELSAVRPVPAGD